MPTANALQRILHPLSVEQFVERYFQRRSFKLSGARRKFDFLLSQDEFLQGLARATRIRAVFPRLRQATISPADVEHMYEAGATICVTGMEQAHPKLHAVAEQVRTVLNYAGTVSFRAYLSPPGSGFDLHFDARVATTLQIVGTKRWWYSDEPAVPFPTHNSGREPKGQRQYERPRIETLKSVVMHPGDLLCLPAGAWHCAKGEGEKFSLALNMAFEHNGAGAFDSIARMLHARLGDDPAWREPLPAVPANGRRLPAPVLETLRSRIDALQAELSALRDNDAELARAWRALVRRP
jgi:ribosomal protein L16 Arg81 hydroxylase